MPKYISLPLPLPDSFTRLTRSTPSESSRSPPSRKKRNGELHLLIDLFLAVFQESCDSRI